MTYECEYQNEVQSALWTCGNVNLLTAGCFFDGKTKILIRTDSKHKNRNTTLVFIEHLFENYIMKDKFNDMHDVGEVI